jgi:hypothetical protein
MLWVVSLLQRHVDLLYGYTPLLEIVRFIDPLQGDAGQWRDCEPGH